MKKYIFAALMCLFAMQGFAQKQVQWIHGLNSDKSFWQRYRQTLVPASYRGTEITWDATEHTTVIARSVGTKVTSNSILIGHSAGGLVARAVQKANSNVKAVVTVGTPNQGAGIVQAMNNKAYYNVIDDLEWRGQRALSKTATALTHGAPPISWIFGPLAITGNLVGGIFISVYTDNGKVILDQYANSFQSQPIVKAMAPESGYMYTLNNHYINVPIVNLYGAEDYWQVIRLGGSAANLSNIVAKSNTSDRTYDETYFSQVRSIQSTVNSIAGVHEKVYKALAWPAIGIPWIWGTRELVKNAENEWWSIANYVAYDMHNIYSEMIGAVHYEWRSYTTGWWFWKKTHWYTVPIFEEHDGLVANKHSQMGVDQGANVLNVRILGVNHLEMSGHPLMKDILSRILNTSKSTNREYGKAFDPEAE